MPALCVDDFLHREHADRLLTFALAHADRFQPSTVGHPGALRVDAEARKSFDFRGSPAEWAGEIEAAVRARCADLAAGAGIGAFPVGEIEFTLSAYRDGCFYAPHIDTRLGAERGARAFDRVLTAVFYVNRAPAGFTGGVLELPPITGAGDTRSFPPRHNRLVAFPAFALHQVTETHVPGDRFEDARFSVNCWLHRADR